MHRGERKTDGCVDGWILGGQMEGNRGQMEMGTDGWEDRSEGGWKRMEGWRIGGRMEEGRQ